MDLIYAQSLSEGMGNINAYELDLAYGSDENDFELRIHSDDHCCEAGYYIFFDGTEYGGIIDAVTSDTENEEVTYTGRTWHGILNSKVLCPDSGQDYLILNGDANAVIGALITRMGLDALFEASSEASSLTISSYKMDRYINGYDGIKKMLNAVGGKLLVSCVDTKVKLSAAPVVDYPAPGETSEGLNSDVSTGFTIKKTYRKVNHLICLGQGELSARTVVHLYADTDGNISQTQTQTGLEEYSAVFNYSNAETTQELTSAGIDRLTELRKQDDMAVCLEEIEDIYDIGDTIGAIDYITGISVTVPVTKKIVSVRSGELSISYETDATKAQASSSGVGTEGDNPVTDYIVEQGTYGPRWNYRKWASGIGECWGVFGDTQCAVTTAWGSMFYGGWMGSDANKAGRKYPFEFVEAPSVTASYIEGSGDAWLAADSGKNVNAKTHAPAFQLIRPTQATIYNPRISYYVIGRWK